MRTLAAPESKTWVVADKPVRCSHCGWDRFWLRPTLMNTAGSTFFGFDWANREANALVCEKCTHIEWFFPPRPEMP